MSSLNRARYEVEIGDGWKRFSERIPAAQMLGVIRVGAVKGALVRYISTGDFLLVRRGWVRTLLARKVYAAITDSPQMERLRAITDEEIDTSDIPEQTDFSGFKWRNLPS